MSVNVRANDDTAVTAIKTHFVLQQPAQYTTKHSVLSPYTHARTHTHIHTQCNT